MSIDSMSAAVERLRKACATFGISEQCAIEEKAQELELRHFIRCVPNELIKEQDIPYFIELVTGQKPSDSLVASVTRKSRGPKIDDKQLKLLEDAQAFRCSLCGEPLKQGGQTHVDHIMPVAFGGKSDMDNYQLLCKSCNYGKGKVIHWLMGAPFLSSDGKELTCGLRYCSLASARGRCAVEACEETSRSEKLEPVLRVPYGKGGRYIFDNLHVLCTYHREREERARLSILKRRHKLRNMAAFSSVAA